MGNKWIRKMPLLVLVVFSTIIGSIIGFIIVHNYHDIGSIADWVSGVGSLGAIWFVHLQIKQQADQFNYQNANHFEIILNDRLISEKNDDGVILYSGNRELVCSGTNSGVSTSSFKFIGICNVTTYQIVKNNHEEMKKDHKYREDPEIYDFDFLIEERKFETVYPGEISKEIAIPLSKLEESFKNEKENLVVVYMDVLGNIYGREVNIKD
ncbi:hypothetical protein [Weissella bombi]|uniref:Uncharacterized protein n=1 Tax=Weissella bombi TaxID=1505725 RepID=A0A1C4C320_9LACO|nr:hypothetical protein [Weissella bombi]SCC13475.1 hypothetical protein GA0061074_12018 [Weissella bombi]